MRPRRFARKGRNPATRAVLVCAGDSITHGLLNANFVKPLQRRLAAEQIEVVNAGMSGDLAVNLLRRLDKIIACRPDVVTILIGTNDVESQIDDKWRKRYERQGRLTEPPTRDTFRSALDEIVRRLLTETSARVALIEIPIMGEDLDSTHNQRVRDYNQIVHTIADAHDIAVLPLHQRLVDGFPTEHRSPPFDGTQGLMGRAIIAHFLRRRRWDAIAADNGMVWLVDNIHPNDRGAAVIADLVEEFALGEVGETPLDVQDLEIRVDGATIGARLYRPAAPTAALLWMHGGGFVAGNIDMPEGDAVSRAVARAGFAVLSVDYRLVPKRPGATKYRGAPAVRFPAPVLDCVAGWKRLADEVGPGVPIFVGGASAGGNLAVMTALRAADAGLAPAAGLVLAYPLLHGSMPARTAERSRVGRALDALTQFWVTWMGRAFSGGRNHSPAFPQSADLAGLPPTVIVTSEKDALRPSGEAFAADLAAAGGDVTITTETGAGHGHLNTPDKPMFTSTIATLTDWMKRQAKAPGHGR